MLANYSNSFSVIHSSQCLSNTCLTSSTLPHPFATSSSACLFPDAQVKSVGSIHRSWTNQEPRLTDCCRW